MINMGTSTNMTNRSKKPRRNLSSTTSGHACADSWAHTGLIQPGHVPDSENEPAVAAEEQEHRHSSTWFSIAFSGPWQKQAPVFCCFGQDSRAIAAVVCQIHLSQGWSGKTTQ